MIALDGIVKTYGMGQSTGRVARRAVEVQALRGVSLQIQSGEWVAITGPSGSGKSTLMHIIGCLDTPTEGSYRLNDILVSGMSGDDLAAVRNRQIGFIFQSFNLLARSTAGKQVTLPLQYRRNGQRVAGSERREQARAALEQVGLGDRLDHWPSELSGGEQQRVAIARALVTQPSILIADEPTGNLDSRSGAEIMDLLHQLHREQGLTIVMVTHDPTIAAQAQRIVRLQDGLIVEGGTA
jgi:putative ABC transport system ATP-binding protein